MWHSWRTWLNVAAVLVLLVVVGCLVYNAAVWASRGYDSVWKDYFPRILFYLVFGIFFLVRLLILPEAGPVNISASCQQSTAILLR